MSQNQSTNRNKSTSDKLKEIDERRKRAMLKAVGAGMLAMIIAIAIKVGLMSVHPSGTLMDILLLLWDVVFMGVPFVVFFVYRKIK